MFDVAHYQFLLLWQTPPLDVLGAIADAGGRPGAIVRGPQNSFVEVWDETKLDGPVNLICLGKTGLA